MFQIWKSKYPDSLFSVTYKRGFQPKIKPLRKQNSPYHKINDVIDKLIYNNKIDTELINKELIDTKLIDTKLIDTKLIDTKLIDTELINKELIDKELPYYDISNEVSLQTLSSLYRDLFFISLFYPEEQLPPKLSNPLNYLEEILDTNYKIDHSYIYCLNNVFLKLKNNPHDYKSYEVIRSINNTETYIKIQAAMNSYTPELINLQQKILESADLKRIKDLSYFLVQHYYILNSILELYSIIKPIEISKQDTIIPSIYKLFQLDSIILDRPRDHQEYIDYNLDMSIEVDLINVIKSDYNCSLVFLRNLNSLNLFERNKNLLSLIRDIIANIEVDRNLLSEKDLNEFIMIKMINLFN